MASGSKCTWRSWVTRRRPFGLAGAGPESSHSAESRLQDGLQPALAAHSRLETHHLHAGIDEQDVDGHAAAQVARQKDSGAGDRSIYPQACGPATEGGRSGSASTNPENWGSNANRSTSD